MDLPIVILLRPSPCMGRIRTRPDILYLLIIDIRGTFILKSILSFSAFLLKPLKIKKN